MPSQYGGVVPGIVPQNDKTQKRNTTGQMPAIFQPSQEINQNTSNTKKSPTNYNINRTNISTIDVDNIIKNLSFINKKPTPPPENRTMNQLNWNQLINKEDYQNQLIQKETNYLIGEKIQKQQCEGKIKNIKIKIKITEQKL